MKNLSLLFLFICLSFAGYSQTAASYAFTAFSGTYSSISSTGTATTAISSDDAGVCSIPIGFTFVYCGTPYTVCAPNSNGYISLANNCTGGFPTYVNATSSYTSISGGVGMLMAYWDDLHGSGHTAYYQTTGTAPNRVFTFEWNNWHTFSAFGNANIQIKLYETSNVIDFIYGGSTYSGLTATIGIANSSTDWQTLPNVSTSPTPSSSTFTSSLSSSPVTNQVYRWSSECTGTPSAGTVVTTVPWGCATYTTTLSLSGSTVGSGITYQWQSSPDSATWTNISGATNSTYVPTITGTIYYRCILTCTYSGGTSTTPGLRLPLYTPPAVITGTTVLCAGQTTTLSDSTTGGVWTSAPTAIATVGSTTGVVTGVSAGTARVTYTLPTGCTSTTTVTITTAPLPITGVTVVCTGFTTSLSDVVGGGSWTSSNTGVATIGSSTGIVTGIVAGTSIITYSLGTGCLVTTTVTVNTTPPAITGTLTVCEGLTTTLSDATPGGTWSSSSIGVATVGSATGVVAGVTAGTARITYRVSNGCYATTVVTVNPLPSFITGLTSVCVASTMTMSDGTPGGIWTSGTPGVATIGSLTGIVTGVSAGLTTITYTLPTGCLTTLDITVLPIPAPITGTRAVCEGFTTTLADATAGGSWSSSDPTVADVGPTTGIVTGLFAGTAIITYSLSTGCGVTASVVVNPTPNPITGVTALCLGYTSTLTDAGGGTWTSSNTAVAPIGSTSGIVSGLTLGTSIITYRLPTGCYTTTPVVVNPLPSAITGSTSLCVGLSTTLSCPGGGTWASSNTAVAPVVTTLGIVSGLSAGTAVITYTLSTGCWATTVVTVTPAPSAISGSTSVCVGSTTTLTDGTPGGRWISSTLGVATVGSSTGIVTGVSAGTSRITYTLGGACIATTTVYVSPLPGAITGALSVCEGGLTMVSSTGTGTWSSSNTGVATVGSSTGIVNGVSAGTATITYRLGTGCFTTATFTVNPGPTPITGVTALCLGFTSTLTDGVPGGAWTSSNTAVATIGSTTGLAMGIALGTSVITYRLPGTGCYTTAIVTVNPLPGAISGPSTVCVGANITLTDAGGGSWTSGNTGVAVVGSLSGVVTGVTAGTTVITYTLSTGCMAYKTVTVNPLPSPISGSPVVCIGATTTLTDASPGGTWSGTGGAATINSTTGVVTGVSAGSSIITYTISTGCVITTTISVSPLPSPITGTAALCVGATSTLADATPLGTWASGNTAIATIGSLSGIVTGVAAGTAVITYTAGCYVVRTVTINPLPLPISGPSAVCVGSTMSLSDGIPGGTWVSGSTGTATINSTTGVVTGIALGTSTITYTLPTGCAITTTISVSPTPTAILGAATVCTGATTMWSNAVPGGAWISGNPAVAAIGSTSGIITGVSAGTSIITYSLGSGCTAFRTVTVIPSPSAIGGGSSVCIGLTTTLTCVTPGGVWSSSTPAVGTIGSLSGVFSGISAGTAVVTYTVPSGCIATQTVTVNPVPSAITGVAGVCVGESSTLGNTVTGGVWTSGNPAVATIDATTGTFTGVAAGTAVITYTAGAGCSSTRVVTVFPTPGIISGGSAVCVGATITLGNSITGGTWTSSNTAVATVGSLTGVVNGLTVGTTIVTYMLSSGCYATTTIGVSLSPTAITGTTSMCAGATTTLGNGVTGGTWVSGNLAVATVGLSSGIVTGVSAGTALITYSIGSGCSVTTVVTVIPMPAPITGIAVTGVSSSTTFSDAVPGGTWSSSTPAVATVGLTTGIVTGVALGTSTITYTIGTSCIATKIVTVTSAPTPIGGARTVCMGRTATLTDGVPGGTWTSSAPAVAPIDPVTGVVTGVTLGTAVISYSMGVGPGLTVTTTITVLPTPAPITGTTSICERQTTLLTDATPGGVWGTLAPGVATVAGGLVTGVSAGTATITYGLGVCASSIVVNVNTTPAAITGASKVCTGATITLANTVAGGTWSSSSSPVASVGITTGVVTGVTAGSATITYAIAACYAVKSVTVYPIAPIAGSPNVCVGRTTTLTDPVTGGNWTSGSTGVATIGFTTGLVTGVAPGTAEITYSMPSGCLATTTVIVNSVPVAITGAAAVCVNSSVTLFDSTLGGTWSSTAPGVATVGLLSGVVTGMSAGTTTISYSLGSGCGVATTILVHPLPSAIAGPASGCVGYTISLTDPTPGGLWTSGDTSVATVGLGTGVVTGVAIGASVITYTLPTGCIATRTITINSLPSPIVGSDRVCVGQTLTLTDVGGGTWASSAPAIADIDSGTGIVNGIAPGGAIISYTLSTGCFITKSITVVPVPAPITGVTNVCVGATTTLFETTPGGVWVSADPTIGSIGSTTGIVSGISSGTVLVSYTLSSGCSALATVIVNPVSPILGDSIVCVGQTLTLTDTTEGGAWSTSNPFIATATTLSGRTGLIYGVSGGFVTVIYTLPTGCRATKRMLVNPAPPAITGPTNVCVGQSITLRDIVSGGTWTSSNPGVATVGTSTGVVSGISAGITTISYTVSGCPATLPVTVNPLPAPIIGSSEVCVGQTTTLVDPTSGGVWTTSRPATATVGGGTGVVYGVAAGTASITYTLATGCYVATPMTVNPGPAPIAGSSNVCLGLSSYLTDATPGGSWSSSDPSVAPIDAFGMVTGLNPGTATISYTLPTGCFAIRVVTVNNLPPAITGPGNVCAGQSITLADAIPGGSWTSGDTAIARVGLTTGVVTGVVPGIAPIVYTLGTGCTATKFIIVDPLPDPIVGITQVCEGMNTYLYDATPAGTWSTSDPSTATIDAFGVVTGVRAGTATITYTAGCFRTVTITVNPMPTAIRGNTIVCLGATNILTNGITGGTWTSSNPGVAPIGLTTGRITGITLGLSNVTYSLGAGCAVTTTVAVVPLPTVFTVSGGGSYCSGGNGVHIYLSGSTVGVNYFLYVGGTPTGSFAGTGSAIDFGLQTVGGTYRVIAISAITGCSSTMAGTATIVVDPTVRPSVSIASGGTSDTICAGASTTFTSVPAFGGTAPTYVWNVNGVDVGVGSSYTFIPANGDRVKVTMTSNERCATPDTAVFTKVIPVSANQIPLVGITTDPGDTVCKGMAVRLTAAPTYGGSSPSFIWMKFGLNVSAGPEYSYIPDDGDIITCFMTSNYPCLMYDTARSYSQLISVDTALIPIVNISASPSYHVGPGKTVTLTANVTNAGLHPTYQWLINGVPVPGATTSVYSSNAFSTTMYDSVSCNVTSSGVCPITSHNWIYIEVNSVGVDDVSTINGDIHILPNPNKGEFVVKGSVDNVNDKDLSVEITNMLGQVVYRTNVTVTNGKINGRVGTGNTLANGMYLVTLRSESGYKVFHMVVEQ